MSERDEDPAFDYIDYYETVSIAEEESNREIERDRWWLDRATQFEVDTRNGKPVLVKQFRFTNGSTAWKVEWKAASLLQGKWSDRKFDSWGDRESALQAYKTWKQQQEGSDG